MGQDGQASAAAYLFSYGRTMSQIPISRLVLLRMMWNVKVVARARRLRRAWRGDPLILLHPGARLDLYNCELFGSIEVDPFFDSFKMENCTMRP